MEKESEKNLIEAIKWIKLVSNANREYKDRPDALHSTVHNSMRFLATNFLKIAFYENKPEIVDLITSKYGGLWGVLRELELDIRCEPIFDEDSYAPKEYKYFKGDKEIDFETYDKLIEEYRAEKRKERENLKSKSDEETL